MSIELIIAFTIGMIILSASPGPGVFSTLAEALSNGFHSAMYFLSGLVVGDIIFLLIAIYGLSYISIFLGELFFIIKICGGIYLIYLGIKMWNNKTFNVNIEKKELNQNPLQKMLAGLFITLGNPKAIMFYASLLPSIIDIQNVNLAETVTIIFIVAAVSYLIIGGYCYFAIKAKSLLKNDKNIARTNKTAGVVMAGTGLYILSR